MSEEQVPQVNWGNIFADMAKLMVIVGIIGVACKFGMSAFERVSPFDSLVSIVSKDQMKDGQNPEFVAEIARATSTNPDFANMRDANELTALMWINYVNLSDTAKAVELDEKRLFYVKQMLALPSIDPQLKDKDGFNALHWASWSGLTKCCEALMSAGLNVNQPEDNGYTPLMLAAERGNDLTVQFLLDNGADPAAKNHAGETAADLARKKATAYHSSDVVAYKLIFNKNRDLSHAATVKIFDNLAVKN